MDGWMDGWMDGSCRGMQIQMVDVRQGGWKVEWESGYNGGMGCWKNGMEWMDGWMDGWMDRWNRQVEMVDGKADRRWNGRIGRMIGWNGLDGWKIGQMEGWMECGWVDGQVRWNGWMV